jgi:hypothetical protein
MTFPRIRPSLQIIARESGAIYIGTAHEGFELEADPYLPILRSCTGRSTVSEIAIRVSCTSADVESLLTQLSDLGLIEFLTSPDTKSANERRVQITGDLITQEREEIESSLISLRHGDGGESEWRSRASLSLMITGDTRVARNLLALLNASGFPQVSLLLEGNASQQIAISDINGLSVTTDDLGKNKMNHHRDLARRSTLGSIHSKYHSANHTHPHLIIATAMPRADEIQRWQSEGISHIAVGDLIGSEVEIFPMITPGLGPCLQCIALHKADALPRDLRALTYPLHLNSNFRHLKNGRGELPVGAAALLAGLLTSSVIDWAWRLTSSMSSAHSASRSHEEGNISRVINLLEPMARPLERRWNFHPECGCVDVRRRASPR